MIAQPGVKVIQYSASNAIEVTWEYKLKGKRSGLRSCWMRLGTGKDKEKIRWTRRLECRGDYKDGLVEEYLENDDIPKTEKGDHVYCQFLFEPECVIDEKTEKIEENDEREMGFSEIVTLISLANAAKYKALLKDKAKPASGPIA